METKGFMALKNILLWSYERGTWQYDLFCLLILAFIFLTPSSWFHRSGTNAVSQREVEHRQVPPRPPVPAEAPTSEKETGTAKLPPAPAIDK